MVTFDQTFKCFNSWSQVKHRYVCDEFTQIEQSICKLLSLILEQESRLILGYWADMWNSAQHTSKKLLERGVRTLKEIQLRKIESFETFSSTLDLELGVRKQTPHSRLKKTAFEIHHGWKLNSEVENSWKHKTSTRKSFNLTKLYALHFFPFHVEGRQTDRLPKKAKRKTSKWVSSKLFFFEKEKHKKASLKIPTTRNRE